MWYPTIPPPDLCLNEDAFLPSALHMEAYKPLFWCHFGGPGGKYLRHLTGIKTMQNDGLLRMYFLFDTEVPVECRSFGRLRSAGWGVGSTMPIDGPGGERIEIVQMRHYYPPSTDAPPHVVREGYMIWCEVYALLLPRPPWPGLILVSFGTADLAPSPQIITNRGRSDRLTGHYNQKRTVDTEVRAAPGTAITGFYATQVRTAGPLDAIACCVLTMSWHSGPRMLRLSRRWV